MKKILPFLYFLTAFLLYFSGGSSLVNLPGRITNDGSMLRIFLLFSQLALPALFILIGWMMIKSDKNNIELGGIGKLILGTSMVYILAISPIGTALIYGDSSVAIIYGSIFASLPILLSILTIIISVRLKGFASLAILIAVRILSVLIVMYSFSAMYLTAQNIEDQRNSRNDSRPIPIEAIN